MFEVYFLKWYELEVYEWDIIEMVLIIRGFLWVL